MDNEFDKLRERILGYLRKLTPIGFVLGIAFAWFMWGGPYDKLQETENHDYPFLPKYTETEFSGIVKKKSSISFYKASLLVTLTNDMKFSMSTFNYNNEYRQAKLTDFLHKGDSIHKPANSDSIYVYRNGKEYYFILGKSINEK